MPCKDAVHKLSSCILSDSKDDLRVDLTKEGQNSGHLYGRANTSNNRINHLQLLCGSWQSHQLSHVRNDPPIGKT